MKFPNYMTVYLQSKHVYKPTHVAPALQKMDNTIYRNNEITIQWLSTGLVDSVIHLLNSWVWKSAFYDFRLHHDFSDRIKG